MNATLERPKTFEEVKLFNYVISFPKLKYEKSRKFKSQYDAEIYMKILLRTAKKQAEKLQDNRELTTENLIIRHLAYEGYTIFEKEWISEISIEKWYFGFKIQNIFEIKCCKK